MSFTALLTEARVRGFAVASLILVFLWFGAMRFSGDDPAQLFALAEGSVLFAPFAAGMSAGELAIMIGIFEILIALGLISGLIGQLRYSNMATWGIVAWSTVSLSLMLTNPVWIDALGGFPAIGKGQTLIKHLTFLGLALTLLHGDSDRTMTLRRLGGLITAGGIALVLLWIGGMKFTLLEAEGIQPLIETSPFLAWTYGFLSVQGLSNLIGVVEIVAAFALLSAWHFPRVGMVGALLCTATFITTLSFMLTLPAWEAARGFPFIGGSGQFLIKDLVLLAGTLVIARIAVLRSA
jgi:reactive chlorine resistance protein C